MDLETLKSKSIGDLKIIASMLGLDVPEKCTKAKLIKMIAGDEAAAPASTAETKAGEKAEAGSEAKAEALSESAPETENKPAKGSKNGSAHTGKRRGRAPSQKKDAKAKEAKAEEKAEEKAADAEVKAADTEAKAPEAQESVARSEKAEKPAEKDDKGAAGEKTEKIVKIARGRKKAAQSKGKKEAEAEAEAEKSEETVKPAEQTEVKDEDLTGVKKAEFQENSEEVTGLLDVMQEGYGFLRVNKYFNGNKDVFVAPNFIRKYSLRTGDEIVGRSRPQRDNDRYQALFYINSINGRSPDTSQNRVPFESLIPIYPDEQLKLETVQNELSTRLIDLIAPIGKGQRGMIVSPPKAGKTVLLKKIANAITANYPDVKLIVLLIDERPEEVTDMRESIQGEVVSSTFDEMPERHIKVAEMVFERARRLVEFGNDVVILMDSLTRLARAYNITITPTGRSLSGGLDPGAMYNPKKFFGAARNIRGGGSLTIVATALIDTGSKMDDVIFEEFKGTGNMELHLDRKLSEKRVFPASDINKSGTRKEELLLSEAALNAVFSIRKAIANAGGADVTEMIVSKMLKTQNNDEFIKSVKVGIERPSN